MRQCRDDPDQPLPNDDHQGADDHDEGASDHHRPGVDHESASHHRRTSHHGGASDDRGAIDDNHARDDHERHHGHYRRPSDDHGASDDRWTGHHGGRVAPKRRAVAAIDVADAGDPADVHQEMRPVTDANLMDADCIHGVTWYDCKECGQGEVYAIPTIRIPVVLNRYRYLLADGRTVDAISALNSNSVERAEVLRWANGGKKSGDAKIVGATLIGPVHDAVT